MLAFLGSLGPDTIVPVFVMAIPILAIVGGITAGIVKTISRDRLIELAQRERIAMIERGLDPSKLPPLPIEPVEAPASRYSPQESARRRSQGLMIGGFVTLAAGISTCIMLYYIVPVSGVWSVGLVPTAVGAALLVSALLVRPVSGGDVSSPPRVG